MKIIKGVVLAVFLLIALAVMFVFEINGWPVGNNVAGILIGLLIPQIHISFQDMMDTIEWKTSQRKLMRTGTIKKNTIVRISFAYLYRIKIGNKYLLVKNERGTGKYQPVGGVYKLSELEKIKLKNLYQVKDDDKIFIDESSRNDYRLRIENKYLRKFMRRFDRKVDREKISNLSREFREELVKKGIVDWNEIKYRYCGRHITKLKLADHFQIYEILLADVVELIPTSEQEIDLKCLANKQSDTYMFATFDQIKSLGVNTETGELTENIADHTHKITQENEGLLVKRRGVGKIYKVTL